MKDKQAQVKTWVTFTTTGAGLPIAHHLQQEGFKSIVGKVQDMKELKIDKKETPEEQKYRLQLHEGITKVYPARKLVDALKKVKNKDDYFIFCENNSVWVYAEELLKAGFTKGIFPTKKDFDMEKEREQAMQFVRDNYPDVQIIPFEKVSTVEEARQLVEESDVPLVIQSEGDYVNTIVGPDDVEQSKTMILAALDNHEKDYSKGEIIIKEKLVQPVEITPQMVFWNGEPVFTDLDIETKNIGCGENNGCQVGCGSNLVIRTEMEDEINKIAFPPKIYDMAKERKGIFVWDISLYITEDGIYFGEFCSNRFGYDSIMTEMTMSHGPSAFFNAIMNGENPMKDFKYGTAINVFNVKKCEEQPIDVGSWKPTWLYDAKIVDDKLMSVGEDMSLCSMTGRGNTVEEAVDNVYDNYETLTFKEKYVRTKEDFLADYPTSIMRRYNETAGVYYG